MLGLARSTLYYVAEPEEELNLELMRLLDEQYTKRPFYGGRKMTRWLHSQGYAVNRKRVQRLLRVMGLRAIAPTVNLSQGRKEHRKYPYLLAGMKIERPNQVWSCDITYIRMARGFLYLVAVMDWFSRYVLSWKLSNSLDSSFCLDALREALGLGQPDIFNTDQGVQFTSDDFTGQLESAKVTISMDGKGRCFDNIFTERLWRTVKYEEVYLKDYADPEAAQRNLREYFAFYNGERLHQSLDYRTPAQVHLAQRSANDFSCMARPSVVT